MWPTSASCSPSDEGGRWWSLAWSLSSWTTREHLCCVSSSVALRAAERESVQSGGNRKHLWSQVKGHLPFLVDGCLQGALSALLHPLRHLHHLLLQGLAALRLRIGQQCQPLGVASRKLHLLDETEEEKGAESRDGTKTTTSSEDWLWASDLLQQLDLGLQDLLHVADVLLPLLQAALQLCFALIGQELRSRPSHTSKSVTLGSS